ncbi:MAG: glycosyltransferase family 4 protein [Planctomycetota bacterium]|nr:MAG: glycosyltransferase family 4 protein [Planctomycetota bacterium]
MALAWFDEKWFRFIRKSSRVYMITSGCALYEKYNCPRTTLVVSSTIREDEFYYREDTCGKDPVRLLFVGFAQPGKGLKYLVEALGMLKTSREVQLAIVGDTQGYSAEKAFVKNRIDELGLSNNISWEGYARFGPELFGQYRRSDILVLPTLSEGAPHVLVEARAFGLPVVSTNVGGIPSSVRDGLDGLLVPPKDSEALAKAIDKVIEDGRLRRNLIVNGYRAAKRFSFEEFIDQLVEVFDRALRER